MKPLTTKRPRTSILNSEFRYTNAANTNLSRRFAEIRKRQREAKAEVEQKVQPIRKVK